MSVFKLVVEEFSNGSRFTRVFSRDINYGRVNDVILAGRERLECTLNLKSQTNQMVTKQFANSY